MFTYDEFVDRLRAENDSDDTELALMLFCIEEEYGTKKHKNFPFYGITVVEV